MGRRRQLPVGLIGSLPTPTAAGLVSAVRALDSRILTASYGARQGATAMLAAIGRAEDFNYIETPAFDHLAFGDADDGDEVTLWQALIDRMDATPSLHVAVCLPFHLLPGTLPRCSACRDAGVAAALTAMAGGDRAERFVAFSPAAGPARSLRLANTTTVVDDAIAIVGTTHLWRRGLSFDSSYAASACSTRHCCADGRRRSRCSRRDGDGGAPGASSRLSCRSTRSTASGRSATS